MAGYASDSLAFEYLEGVGVLVSYQSQIALTTADWKAYIATVTAVIASNPQLRVLRYNAGRHRLSTEQQRLLRAAAQGTTHRVALVTPDGMSGFMVSVFALLNPNVRSFAESDFASALEYLMLKGAERNRVESSFERLRLRTCAA